MQMDGERFLCPRAMEQLDGLRRAFANVIKKICTEKLPVETKKDETLLEACFETHST